MAKRQTRNVSDVLKQHNTDIQATPAERLAKFLDHVAIELPKRFVDRRIAAKIAFAQKRMPGEDSDYVKKKLPSVMARTKGILMDKEGPYERDLYTDRVEGIRATVDAEDIVQTTHRQKRSRVVGAINSLEKTDSLVDSKKLDAAHRAELTRARRAQKALEAYKSSVPLLAPAKNDD